MIYSNTKTVAQSPEMKYDRKCQDIFDFEPTANARHATVLLSIDRANELE